MDMRSMMDVIASDRDVIRAIDYSGIGSRITRTGYKGAVTNGRFMID